MDIRTYASHLTKSNSFPYHRFPRKLVLKQRHKVTFIHELLTGAFDFKLKCLSVANIESLKLSHKTISWMGFQIGSNENGWSKILTLRVYKTLAFMVHKQKMPWLPLSECVYNLLNIYVFGGGNWCSSTLAKTLAHLTWSTSGMFLTFLVYWMSAHIQLMFCTNLVKRMKYSKTAIHGEYWIMAWV